MGKNMSSIIKIDHIQIQENQENEPQSLFRRKLSIDNSKWFETYKPYSRTVLLFITNACNLHCDYCFNHPNLFKLKSMNLEYIRTIVEANPGLDKYDLMGGEPLLHPQIDEIIEYLQSQDKKIGLYTNGYFLPRLGIGYKNLKLNISFQSLESTDKSLKPLTDIAQSIEELQHVYPIKLVFLMNNFNKHLLPAMAEFVEDNFLKISKLTIGAVRNEADYWNDDYPYVVPMAEYYDLVQEFINNYKGRLNIDIFTKGALYTESLPKSQENQLNRFKSVYVENQYVPCLYLIARNVKVTFDPSQPIPFPDCNSCGRTGLQNCLADKIRLRNLQLNNPQQ